MAHWFDDLTTNLARVDRAPRRSFLRMIGAAVGAGVVARASFPADALAQSTPGRKTPARINRPAPANTCGRRTAGTLVVREASFDQGGLTLHRRLSFDRRTKSASMSTTVSRGQSTIFKMDVTATGGGGATAVASYGADVQGIKSVTMTSKDGRAFQGSMDGRAFRGERDDPRLLDDVQFFDGQRAPEIVLDPKLGAAIDDLAATAG